MLGCEDIIVIVNKMFALLKRVCFQSNWLLFCVTKHEK